MCWVCLFMYLKVVELMYISDGDYDAGHYDLVVRDPVRLSQIEEVYAVWREQKIRELYNWDNRNYGT